MKLIYVVLCIITINSTFVFAQHNVQIKGFGHIETELEYYDETNDFDMSWALGEQSLFVTGTMGKKFSYLGEMTLNYSTHGTYRFNIERTRLKFNYYGNHSAIIGKFHTPVNYWNDVYFHARLFFPTSDRPIMFSKWVPVHTYGARMQGQNLGKYNFGYDLLLGGGLTSEDVYNIFDENSITAAVHIKPIDGMRIGGSFYYTHIADNSATLHHHHDVEPQYSGAMDYHLASFSFARFEKPLEILNEFSTLITRTDTLGTAVSYSNFIYVGYNIKNKFTPYVLADFLQSANNNLRNGPLNQLKLGVGYKHEFTPTLNLKIQYERYTNIPDLSDNPGTNFNELTIQFSYAIY